MLLIKTLRDMYLMIDDELKWALLPWLDGCVEDFAHPDDLNGLKEVRLYGGLCKVICEGKDYVKIEYNKHSFRVRRDVLSIFSPKSEWLYEIGERVGVVGKDYVGSILGIGWHYKMKKPTYGLIVNGKRKSRRYWPEDLIKMDPS